MSEFKRLSDSVWATEQIDYAGVAAAARQGFALVVNNRPDGEQDGQPTGAEIERAARDSGLDYVAIPVDHSGFNETQVNAMADVLEKAEGNVLAYCRSGTRSTFLWALARASKGEDPAALEKAARDAGYDISAIVPMLKMLRAKASG